MKDLLKEKIKHLFQRQWDEELSEEEENLLYDEADNLVAEYEWVDVFNEAFDFLKTSSNTPEDAINFALLYWDYGWYEYPISEPHKFLGYLYYRIDFDTARYDFADILDSLSTTILKNAGFSEADLVLNTQYMPENDPKIIEAAEKYKNL